MGDRGNIVIQFEGNPSKRIYLYTHWAGYNRKATLAAALERGKPRWGDDSYLARIIFCEMVKGDISGETGFGISLEITDNEYPLLVVDMATRTVFDEPVGGYQEDAKTEPVSFAEFVNQFVNQQQAKVEA